MKIEHKPVDVPAFKAWAEAHGLPILVNDKVLEQALEKANEKTRKHAEALAAKEPKK